MLQDDEIRVDKLERRIVDLEGSKSSYWEHRRREQFEAMKVKLEELEVRFGYFADYFHNTLSRTGKALEYEREECALLAERFWLEDVAPGAQNEVRQGIADAIRARR